MFNVNLEVYAIGSFGYTMSGLELLICLGRLRGFEKVAFRALSPSQTVPGTVLTLLLRSGVVIRN